jgi:hypothetical protein
MLELRAFGESVSGSGASWCPLPGGAIAGHHGLWREEIARLVGHSSSRTTEVTYRMELRPVLVRGAEIIDQVFW